MTSLSIDAGFDSGNIEVLAIDGTTARLAIRRDNASEFFQWFHFRVAATAGETLRVLLDATAGDALDALVLFSSVAGRFGNRGQADYAMANETLNKVAQSEFRRRGGRCVEPEPGRDAVDGRTAPGGVPARCLQ